MPFFHLRLSAPHSTLNQVPLIGSVVQPTGFPSKTENWSCHLPVLRNWSPLVVFVSPLPRLCSLRAMHIGVDLAETCDLVDVCHSMLSMSSYDKQSLSKEGQLDHDGDAPVSISDEEKERQRRKRIGLANKGRIPWNKGRKHTAETCERIKQRTIEALKDPQVRKKMSEHPHPHSEESKAKMRSTLKRIWGQRLKLKRLKEKFFLSWVESIAEAAKKGGSGQRELYWDSFEKILQELNLQQLQQAAEKEKAKAMETTKKREKKAGKAKAKEMVRLARERKKDEDIREKDEEVTTIQGLKRKQRLEKLDRKTSTNGEGATRGEIVMSHISAFEKLDLKLVKTEKMRKVVSFADQIRAAKNKKMELAIAASTSAHAANEKPREYV